MNRKKITLLLTGLVVASSMLTGCTSNNKSADNGANVAQGEDAFRRATDRTVTEYTGDGYGVNNPYTDNTAPDYNPGNYPNVAYGDEITDGALMDDQNIFSGDTNVYDNGIQNGETTNDIKMGARSNDTNLFDQMGTDYEMTPYEMSPSDEIISNDNINSFSNGNTMTGFGGAVVEDDISSLTDTNDLTGSNSSQGTDIVDNSGISQGTGVVDNSGQGNIISPNNGVSEGTTPSTSGLTINNNAQNDPNLPQSNSQSAISPQASTERTTIGEFVPLKSVGSSEVIGTGDDGNIQGVIYLSFKLSGEVLNKENLSGLISGAFDEAIKDSNSGWSGEGTTTAREALQAALKKVICDNNTGKTLMFRDPKGTLVNVPISDIFPDKTSNKDYVRGIIDLNSMRTTGRTMRTARSTDSKDVVLRMMIRNSSASNNDNSILKTNTDYTFVGIGGTNSDGNNIKVDANDNQFISGFTVPECRTGKSPSILTAQKEDKTTSVIYQTSSGTDKGTLKDKYITTMIKPGIYLNMTDYHENVKEGIVASGTSIKYKNIVLNDPDSTIVKIEMQDARGTKYTCSLVPVDLSNKDNGYYVQVNNLERDMSYTFTKLLVTSNTGVKDKTVTIDLANVDASNNVTANQLSVRTTQVSEPKIELGSAKVTEDVTLPNGLKVKPVKNDSTALRYIVKVDNNEGNIGDLQVLSLTSNEKADVKKIEDSKTKTNYYIVTLTGLTPNTDYSHVIFELGYKDASGNDKTTRQSIGNIYKTDDKNPTMDNRTEKEALTGLNDVNVIMNDEFKSEYARKARVPVFVDDIYGRVSGMTFKPVTNNSDVKVEYKDSYLDVTGLKPNATTTITLEFNYKDASGNDKVLTKYLKVMTPAVPEVDIKSDTATVKGNEVTIKLEYYENPKSPIKAIEIKDKNSKVIRSSWDKTTNTITLYNLESNKEYSELVVTFTLENKLTSKYELTPFTTSEEIIKPTGAVADFVARVYTIALGREPEVEGWNFWIGKLTSKEISATEFIAENLMTQPEFVDRELSKSRFVTTMYSLIVNREPDSDGQNYWERKYDEYKDQVKSIAELRIKIAKEMMDQPEFKELVTKLQLIY